MDEAISETVSAAKLIPDLMFSEIVISLPPKAVRFLYTYIIAENENKINNNL